MHKFIKKFWAFIILILAFVMMGVGIARNEGLSENTAFLIDVTAVVLVFIVGAIGITIRR